MVNIRGLDSSKMAEEFVIRKSYCQNVSGSTYQKLTWQIIAMHRKYPHASMVMIEFTGEEFPRLEDDIVDQLRFIKKALGIPVFLNNQAV